MKTSLRNLASRALRASGASPSLARLRRRRLLRSFQAASVELAEEFGTSPKVMSAFMQRFAPVLVEPAEHAEPSDTMLFVHIPKTAGVSVGKALQQSFDRFHGVVWNNVPASFRALTQQALYEQTRSDMRQVIMGHFGWNELMVWQQNQLPMKCATILRDPIDRLVSNYNYNCSDKHPARESFMARFPTIKDFALDVPHDVQLTQAVGLVGSFEGALEKLTRHYSFIGVTERLPQSLAHLSRSHGLPDIQEYHANAGTRPADGLRDQVVELVRERNHNDIKLHALMTRLYDLPAEPQRVGR